MVCKALSGVTALGAKEARSSVEHDRSDMFFLLLGWTKNIVSPITIQNKPKYYFLHENLEQVNVHHLQLPQFSFAASVQGSQWSQGEQRGNPEHKEMVHCVLTTSHSSMGIYRSLPSKNTIPAISIENRKCVFYSNFLKILNVSFTKFSAKESTREYYMLLGLVFSIGFSLFQYDLHFFFF